ncbi:unnamed protein product [Toxocara canis]|uniref:RPA_C domain-containing protein n=1 Tax=Toxocara canis TaxID=6265 RepID=A0A183VE42_TOXCA|nr:unnamed protein product [Toxocara canis]
MGDWDGDALKTEMNGDEWSDTLYFAGDNTALVERPRSTDGIPLPVTIGDLAMLDADQEDGITVGKTHFTTVHVIGRVKRVEETDQGQTIKYEMADLRHPNAFFCIIHYKGIINNGENTSPPYAIGTHLSIVGKIRNFDDQLCVVAFGDVPEMIASGNTAPFENTMLRGGQFSKAMASPLKTAPNGSAGDRNEATRNWPQNLAGPNSTRGALANSAAFGHSRTTNRGLIATFGNENLAKSIGDNCWNEMKRKRASNSSVVRSSSSYGLAGQKAEIFKYLCNHSNSTAGESIEDIRESIPSYIYSEHTFTSDLNELAADGLIMQAIDDEHFIANQ